MLGAFLLKDTSWGSSGTFQCSLLFSVTEFPVLGWKHSTHVLFAPNEAPGSVPCLWALSLQTVSSNEV